VEVQTGALQLANGASAGVFDVSSGATLEFLSGTHGLNSGAIFNGPGLTRVAGGSLWVNEGQWSNVNGPLALTGSAIGGGSGSFFNIFNSFAWSGGNLSGDWGEISVRSGATMTISTATDKQIATWRPPSDNEAIHRQRIVESKRRVHRQQMAELWYHYIRG
jgi:hypothetical protein